jgi:DNA-binding NarL/FixJ family response regulator
MVVAGEAASGEEVLEVLARAQFDLLLLDLTMPGLCGIELIEKIRAQYAALPILIFSMRSETQAAKLMAEMGVGGYITKGCSDEMLLSAIRKVASGGNFMDPLMAEKIMFDEPLNETSKSAALLSSRELQILKLLGQGKSIKEIAGELLINSRTVSTYKTRLMQKMNFKNNAELVLYAAESGLV